MGEDGCLRVAGLDGSLERRNFRISPMSLGAEGFGRFGEFFGMGFC